MDTQEKIYAWKPIEGLEGKFYLQSICHDKDGFRILLISENSSEKSLLINFFGTVRSFRESDDLLSMHLLQGSVEPYEGFVPPKPGEDMPAWSFFKITDSDYLKWASYQSDKVSEHIGLIHYAIWTPDWTIDVLSWAEPLVKFITLKQ